MNTNNLTINADELAAELLQRNQQMYFPFRHLDAQPDGRKPSGLDKDVEILASRIELYDQNEGIRVGDYLERLDGTTSRVTHDWDDSVQDGGGSGSFYLGGKYCSYSGGLNPSISKSLIVDTGRIEKGLVWFFHKDWAQAHGGVYAEINFRVFKEVAA